MEIVQIRRTACRKNAYLKTDFYVYLEQKKYIFKNGGKRATGSW
jgi:hypothetical protein